jgi:hypothetical protein
MLVDVTGSRDWIILKDHSYYNTDPFLFTRITGGLTTHPKIPKYGRA